MDKDEREEKIEALLKGLEEAGANVTTKTASSCPITGEWGLATTPDGLALRCGSFGLGTLKRFTPDEMEILRWMMDKLNAPDGRLVLVKQTVYIETRDASKVGRAVYLGSDDV